MPGRIELGMESKQQPSECVEFALLSLWFRCRKTICSGLQVATVWGAAPWAPRRGSADPTAGQSGLERQLQFAFSRTIKCGNNSFRPLPCSPSQSRGASSARSVRWRRLHERETARIREQNRRTHPGWDDQGSLIIEITPERWGRKHID